MNAKGDVFGEPVCLISCDQSGQLVADDSVLAQIESVGDGVNVVAVAGLYRTGKSYLLNRLAGKNQGFPLGSTVESKTKGIWVWCLRHPLHSDQTLVLLDTEGLGDVNKGDVNHDNWIFALATLLSSTLVYNAIGPLDQSAIEKLNFVTEISKRIKTKGGNNQNEDFDLYFPTFIVTLRDFTLELKLNGKDITADEYLEHALTLREETSESIKRFNEPRRCIRRYFNTRKCFTFERPGNREVLKDLETLSDADLDKEFVRNAGQFCSYVYHCEAKKLDNGTVVTGRMFASLVRSYVDAIRNGGIPCIESALVSMAKLENQRAVDEAVQHYETIMSRDVQLPTESDEQLSSVHREALKEAVSHFLEKAVYDEKNEYQQKMNGHLQVSFRRWVQQNEAASVDKTLQTLEQLNGQIAQKLQDGGYLCNGGFKIYQKDLFSLQEKFAATSGLGVKAKETFMEFMSKKRSEGEAVLAADEKVSDEEKKVEVERHKALEADRRMKAAEREAEVQAQRAQEAEKAREENIAQLDKKRREDIENMQKHYDDVIKSRLEEQRRTLKEGFDRESRMLERQIDALRQQRPSGGGGGGCVIL